MANWFQKTTRLFLENYDYFSKNLQVKYNLLQHWAYIRHVKGTGQRVSSLPYMLVCEFEALKKGYSDPAQTHNRDYLKHNFITNLTPYLSAASVATQTRLGMDINEIKEAGRTAVSVNITPANGPV